jgi:AcrR family transcriptional regulator
VTREPSTAPPALQARSRVTQERIFAAGTRILEEGGQAALTIAAVAEAAGVSVGGVYRRFGDKERLLHALQARFTQNFRAEFRRRVADTGLSTATPASDVIDAAVTGMVDTFRQHAPLLRVFMLLGTQNAAVFAEGAEASVQGGRTFRDTVLLAALSLRHHADVEVAVDFAYRLAYSSCAHRVIFGENLESTRPLPWGELSDELCRAVRAYLLAPTSD